MADAFQTSRDLSVRLARDRPQDFVRLLETLSGAGVAIEGVTDVDSVVHILAADPRAARLALREGGFAIDRELEVLVIPLTDRIDGLSTILRHLAAAGVNAQFVYMASQTRVVIGPDDMTTARKTLGSRN